MRDGGAAESCRLVGTGGADGDRAGHRRDGLSEEEKKTTLSGYAALKSLIIKTADFAAANSEVWSAKLAGNYVAASDFGTYLEKTQLTIEGNSVGIKQLYDYTAA